MYAIYQPIIIVITSFYQLKESKQIITLLFYFDELETGISGIRYNVNKKF